MNSLATVQLECSIGAYKFSEQFLVVEELAIPVIFGYMFMKSHVMSIYPNDDRITFRDHITAYAKAAQENTPNRNSEYFIRVAQQIILPPTSETNVLVHTLAEGLCILHSLLPDFKRKPRKYLMTNGLKEVLAKKAFVIRVMNIGSNPTLLQKHTVLGYAQSSIAENAAFTLTTPEESHETSKDSIQTETK
jgi:hypothetical protein